MKKLIKDSFAKTAFSFNNKIYKQTDGVSMVSGSGQYIYDRISKDYCQRFIWQSLIKVLVPYADEILLLVKEKDIKLIH